MIEAIAALARRSLTSAVRRPVVLTFSLAQPLVWMALFGFLFGRVVQWDRARPYDYQSFVAPGIALMSVLFGASQSGVSVVRDFQSGMLARMGATRTPATARLLGKIVGDGTRLILQAIVVLLLALALGARFHPDPRGILLACTALLALVLGLASISCLVAALARAPEPMGTYVHLVNMPLLFTSTALVPDRQMPTWLAKLAPFNPLSVAAEAWRAVLLGTDAPSWSRLAVPVFIACLAFVAAAYALDRAAHAVE